MESGRWRWTQRSSSATDVPSALRKSTIGSPRIIRPNGLRATSWSEAATYQKFFRNIGHASLTENCIVRGGIFNATSGETPVGWVERKRNSSSASPQERPDGFRCGSTHPTRYALVAETVI